MFHFYYSLENLIELVDPASNRKLCAKILAENEKLFKTAQGSTRKHQAWPGGYWDHIQETMNLGLMLHYTLNNHRILPFTFGEALLVLFLHDIEKPWSYEIDGQGIVKRKPELQTKPAMRKFREKKLTEYGIRLTPHQENAMKYVEGESDDYTNKERVMTELAGFCHICDALSAIVFHDRPLEKDETWGSRHLKTKTS